jgi:hypothetical protein
MLFRFMQKCGLSSSRAYCIFLKSTNRNVQNVLLLKSWMAIGQNCCYWLVEQKYNTHVTMKDHIFA